MTSPLEPDAVELAGSNSFVVANEFAEVRVRLVHSRNGDRVLIESPKTDSRVTLCPLELQALTWQNTATFTAMLAKTCEPLLEEQP